MIRFKANKGYWGEKAIVDDLVYAITPDPTAHYSKLKAGECHFVIAPRLAVLPEMQKDPALSVNNSAQIAAERPLVRTRSWPTAEQQRPL